jgi:hypothetical protein
MIKRLTCLILFLNINIPAFAQFYISGQEPSATKWFTLESNAFKIIYPKASDSLALVFAKQLDEVTRFNSKTLKHIPKKFPVIIRTRNSLPNGFVAWAPRRMEIVSTSPPDADSELWLRSLAIHESRHMVQIDKLNRSTVRLGYYLLGETAIGLTAALVPLWFLEGDAVFAETALGFGGRGRQASFLEPFRTHFLEFGKDMYGYDKWLLGSYKNKIPNHYHLGYLMVGYVNETSTSAIWPNTLDYVSSYPFTFFPFYFGLKKETNLSRKALFAQSFRFAGEHWKAGANGMAHEKQVKLNNDFIEYQYPLHVSDTTVILLKTSLNYPPVFVIFNTITQREKKLFEPGYVIDRPFFKEGVLYWSEYKADARYGEISYSNIWQFALDTKRGKPITNKGRFFSPAVANSNKIWALGIMDSGFSGLFEITTEDSFKQLLLFHSMEPKEIAIGKEEDFYVRASTENGNIVLRYKNETSQPDTILGPIHLDISNMVVLNSFLYFTASDNGVQNIYGLNLLNNIIFKYSNATYGINYFTCMPNSSFFASLNGPYGNRPIVIPIDSLGVTRHWNNNMLYHSGIERFRAQSQNDTPNSMTDFTSAPYKEHRNLFKFHSWAPFYYNPIEATSGEIMGSAGFTLISQNLTSTAISSLGYSYNETHGVHAQFSWLGWYPIISGGIDFGNELPRVFGVPSTGIQSYRTDTRIEGKIRVTIPYQLSSGKYYSRIGTGISLSYNNDWVWNEKRLGYKKSTERLNFLGSYYRLKRMAHRDLRPSLGFYIIGNFQLYPSASEMLGESVVFRGLTYLPGAWTSHSLLITSQAEVKVKKQYFLSSRVALPRGENSSAIFRNLYSASADYAFPIAYPDRGIGSLIYIKRLFINIFSDNAFFEKYYTDTNGNAVTKGTYLHTTGVELFSDTHFLRTRYEFRIGYRAGYHLGRNEIFQSFWVTFNPSSLFGHLPRFEPYSLNL